MDSTDLQRNNIVTPSHTLWLVLTSLVLIACLIAPTQAQAEPGWIGDSIFVPVRSGAGNTYRILHRGLRSGTQVTILEWDENNNWARIRHNDIEGWVETQFLSRTPVAAIQLEQVREQLDRSQQQAQELRNQLAQITRERDQLRNQTRDLEQQREQQALRLEELRQIAADPVRLAETNQQLNEDLSLLRMERDQLQAENALLRNDKTVNTWVLAVLTIFAGIGLGWYFKSRASRQRSSWA